MARRLFPLVRLLAVVVFALTVGSGPIRALTELITNGTFDTDVSGWTPTSTHGAISWAGTEGHSAVGAARVENDGAHTVKYSEGAYQCVVLNSPVNDYYEARGWVKVPSQANTTAYAFIRVHFYSSTTCSGSVGSNRDTDLVPVGSDWTFVTLYGTSTPPGALSAKVRLLVQTDASSGPAYAYFDDVSFYPSTATAITLDEARATYTGDVLTSWEIPLLTGGVLLAVASLRGRR